MKFQVNTFNDYLPLNYLKMCNIKLKSNDLSKTLTRYYAEASTGELDSPTFLLTVKL
jgi:hypothetical protein